MTIEEIIQQCGHDSKEWFAETADSLPFQVLALAGEVGEVANEVKKVERGTAIFDEQCSKIEEEAIDVFIYLCNIFHILGTNVSEAYSVKREFNRQRFGRGPEGS